MKKLLGSLEALDEILAAEEAINFQPNSQFPHELTNLFKEVFRKIDDYKQSHDDKTTDEVLQKHRFVKSIIEGEIGSKIASCIEKYTGFKLRKISSCLPSSINNTFSVYVMIEKSTESFEDLCMTIGSSSGYGSPSQSIDKSNLIKQIIDISRSLDKEKAKILRGSKWSVIINIPVGLFVVEDILSGDISDCQVSAENMTAILLHEIGHIFSWVEYLGDLGYSGYYGNNILRDVTSAFEADPNKVLNDAIEYNNDNVSKLKNEYHKKLVNGITKVLTAFKVHFDNDTDDNEDISTYKFNFIKFIVAQIIRILIFVYLSISTVVEHFFIPFKELMNSVKLAGNALSRDYTTEKNANMFERLADEYVSRYGMSKYLNDALIRIHNLLDKYNKAGYGVPLYNKTIRDFFLIKLLAFTIAMPTRFLFYIVGLKYTDVITGYENDYTRLSRNIKNMYDVLKDSQIDPEIRNMMLNDIDEMNDQLKHVKHKVTLNIFEKIIKLILSASDNTVGGIKYIFGSANGTKDFYKLFENLDDMLSNKSYYYAAKFAQLLGK